MEFEENTMTEDAQDAERQESGFGEETRGEHQDGVREDAEGLQTGSGGPEGEPEDETAGEHERTEPGNGERGQRKQTREDNDAARGARRRAEQQTAARLSQEYDERMRAAGITNPYTGKPFQTMAEFEDYAKQYHEDQIQDRARKENRSVAELRREAEDRRLAEEMREEKARRKKETESRKERETFIREDAADFLGKYPDVDLGKLEQNQRFRKFCGSRFGREPLAELYAAYTELTGETAQEAVQKRQSREARGVGSGAGTAGGGLTPAQQTELERWNAENPTMKMTAKEFLSR